MNSIDSEADDNSASRKLDLLDLMLKSTENGTSFSRNNLRDEVVTFIFGGYHTTSSAISFVMYCLAENPEVQQIAFEEQMEIFEKLSDAQPTFSDLQKMKYLEMVIKETLRLYSPVPLFPRKVQEHFEYGGNLYPKGLSIWMLPYLTHRNPEYFPEPLKFIPERFEKEDVGNSFTYLPFSLGSRSCIGRGLAMIELKSVISKVLRNFELVPATPKSPLILSPDVVMTSKNGINISIRRRDNNSNILKINNSSDGLTRRRTMV